MWTRLLPALPTQGKQQREGRGPGQGQLRVRALMHAADWVPTFMALAGVGSIYVLARRRYTPQVTYANGMRYENAPQAVAGDAAAAARPCKVTLFEHGFHANQGAVIDSSGPQPLRAGGVRQGLPPVVVTEGAGSDGSTADAS